MLQINASIARHHDKTWCVFRTQHLYNFNAENILTELDKNLEPISDKPLIAENNNTAFEDIRLFSFKGKLLAFYNYLPFQENIGWKIIYAVGYGEIDLETGILKNQVSMRGASKRFHEKNWSPYNYQDELFMVTDFDPFLRVIKIDLFNEQSKVTEIFLSPLQTKGWAYGELRGGTPLITKPGTDDGWYYGFIHSFLPDEMGFQRNYYYTIVRYSHIHKYFEYHPQPLPYADDEPDEDYTLLWRLSNGRRFKVIFPIGIMHHEDGVMVSFGKDDVCSYYEYFSWDKIEELFATVD